jgi:hypothetical protein
MRTRYLETYHDGVRLGRTSYQVRLGRVGGFGLSVVWMSGPISKLVLAFGPWGATVTPVGTYVGPMREILSEGGS